MSNNKQRQEFLLSFFEKDSGYSEIKVNNFWLIKSSNSDKTWKVGIFTEESYQKYKGSGRLFS